MSLKGKYVGYLHLLHTPESDKSKKGCRQKYEQIYKPPVFAWRYKRNKQNEEWSGQKILYDRFHDCPSLSFIASAGRGPSIDSYRDLIKGRATGGGSKTNALLFDGLKSGKKAVHSETMMRSITQTQRATQISHETSTTKRRRLANRHARTIITAGPRSRTANAVVCISILATLKLRQTASPPEVHYRSARRN